NLEEIAEYAYGQMYIDFFEKYGEEYANVTQGLRNYLNKLPNYNDSSSKQPEICKERHGFIALEFVEKTS
ncbi:hypothetical protein OHW85_23200, partial [Acinetobacter baumannii]|nr:hypothetical protein [Acinetobacter baumannii]